MTLPRRTPLELLGDFEANRLRILLSTFDASPVPHGEVAGVPSPAGAPPPAGDNNRQQKEEL